MDIKEYHSREEMGSTNVKKAILGSAEDFKYSVSGPPSKSTSAMDEGSAVHCRLGEPHLFSRDFASKPKGMSFVSKEGKAWKAANKDKTLNDLFAEQEIRKLKITNIKNQTNRLEELFIRLTTKND